MCPYLAWNYRDSQKTMPGAPYKDSEHFHSDFLVLNSTLFFSFWNNPIHRDKPAGINKEIAFFY